MAMMRRGQARRLALVAMILLLIAVVSAQPVSARPAGAQVTTPTIETAELRLWPEYDDPGLLVIISGQFAEGTTLPLQASIPIPEGARNIQATYQDASGSLINRPFEVKDGKLTYELLSRGFHVEYYVDRAPSGEERDITFDFEAPYATNALSVAVQQPARSTGFSLAPAAEETQAGTDGLTYHVFNRRNLAAGEELGVEVKYSKADTGLSAPQLAVAATGAVNQPSASAATATTATVVTETSSWLPWLLIGLGVLLLAAVLVYWVLSQRRTSTAGAAVSAGGPPAKARPAVVRSATPPGRASTAGSVRPQATDEPLSFCTNCGHPLKPEDRFCSQCGAPRRS